ncbi:DNA recombination protein RmuC [Maricaulis sp.]|uniref:DNA recombination protein RmuC n=1 Tax=Maricaulis sp. TaxID=1486257 RepID=UPI0025BA637B|nr:DNA recombination protein RmuC [Maricaulis sp.]
MTLTDISPETWLVLGGMAVTLAVLAGLLLTRKPAATTSPDTAELDRLRAERDDWRERQEQAATDLATAREAVARLDGVVEERDRLRASLEAVTAERNALNARHEALKTEHDATQRHHDEKLAELDKARERLSEQFKLTAAEILKTSGAELNKQSTDNLQTLLNPLREQLTDFRAKVEKDAEQRHGHAGEIKQLMETVRKDAARMSDDAQKLANALRSSSKVQGDWGELVLARILESSGLREGHEFHTQKSETLEDGSRLRPDIVVDLPGGHRLVIDSKVSLKAFDQCVNAETEEERGLALKQHIQSVRNHVNSLGAKDYGQLYTGVSFTLMFIPLEGAASLALQNDVNISVYAAERDVMIATPTTLMMAMRTIGNLWTVDRQNRNALDIADRAGKLFDKFHGFVSDIEEIGQRINQAENAWSNAKGKLIDGPGNLVGQAQKLKDLGAKTRKSLPAEYLDAAGVEDLPAIGAPEAVDS